MAQGGFDLLALLDLLAQGGVGVSQLVDVGDLVADVAAGDVGVAGVGHGVPGDPAVAAVAVAQAVDEALGDPAAADDAHGGQAGAQVVGMDQGDQALVEQVVQRPAEDVLPGRVQRQRGGAEVGDRQQVARQLPGPVAFAGAFLDALAEGLVEALEGLGGGALLGDVHRHADEAAAAALVEEGLAAHFQPAHLAVGQLDAVGGSEVGLARVADGGLDACAHVGQVVGVAEPLEHRHVQRLVAVQAADRPVALVAQPLSAGRLVVPHAQACRLDGQARAHADLLQGLFRLAPAAALVDFRDGAGDRLGQQREVLLEDVVHRARAHHVDRVLLAVHAGEEDEGGFRRQAAGFLQGQAAGEAGQDEVGEDQVEWASLQGLDDPGVVVDQFGVQRVAAALQRHLGQFGVVRAVFDEQDTDVL